MEPHVNKQKDGLAPTVGWSDSPITSPVKISVDVSETPDDNVSDNAKANGTVPSQSGLLEVKFEDLEKDSIMSSTSSLSLDEDDDDDAKPKPKIPDGGWGWVVVASSLIISMIADGISFSFGLLYIEFLDHFGASKSATSWIGSLFVAVPLLTGPIMSALVDRYGCRLMTMIGGVISAFGFLLSVLSNSIGVMYLTFGIIAGIGLGLCYVTAVVSIAYWFDKKRTLAVGLGACGTGVGTFVYAPMTTYFISEYGWRGTILLLAGTFLNLCVCGAVMRDPEWIIQEEQSKSLSAGKRSLKNASSTASLSGKSESETDFPGVEEIRRLMKSGEKPEYILQSLVTSMEPTTPEEPNPKERYQSVVNLPTFVKQSEKVPLEVLEQLSENKKLYNVILENYPSLLLCRSTSDRGLNKITEDVGNGPTRVPVRMSMKLKKAKLTSPTKYFTRQESLLEEPESDKPLIPDTPHIITKPILKKVANTAIVPLTRTDSLIMLKTCGPNAKHYLKNLRVHKHSVVYRGAMLNISKYRLRASSCPDIYRNSMTTLARESEDKWYTELHEFVTNMVDFSLYLDLHFLILSISTTLLFTWFIVPYFYLAEHLTRHGYTESEASVVLSVIGVTNTIGMIGLGWAGDQPWVHITKTYSVCLILCGISCACLMLFATNYTFLLISAACFGLFFSSNFSFTPAILVDLISLDNFTQAYGLILLCQGMGHLLGPPIAGALFDLTGTWEQSFWQAGLWIAIAGVGIAFIPFTENRKIWKTNSDKDWNSEKTSVA